MNTSTVPTVTETDGRLVIEWPDPKPASFEISAKAFEELISTYNDRGDRIIAYAREIDQLAATLQDARDMVCEWSAYASGYFKEKWDLEGDLAKLDAVLARVNQPAPAS